MSKVHTSIRIAALTGIACTALSAQAAPAPTAKPAMDVSQPAQRISAETLVERARAAKAANLLAAGAAHDARTQAAQTLALSGIPPIRGIFIG